VEEGRVGENEGCGKKKETEGEDDGREEEKTEARKGGKAE
jgi:hypothetical protein